MGRPTYACIDLDAIIHNCHAVKNLVGGRSICAAVKADGYGHGAPAVARAMDAGGVDMFAVAMTEEGIELRDAGIDKPVILLTAVPPKDISSVLDNDLTSCICNEAFAHQLSQEAQKRHTTATAHINIDTGMRRVGIPHEEAAETVARIMAMPGLEITGMFTHFACSEDRDISHEQLRLFRGVTRALQQAGIELPMLHVANSTATLTMPETHMDCVRPGLILYGMRPPALQKPVIELDPALSLHTEISFCKRVPADTPLGYGHTFRTERESVIATLPIGYHDGYMRQYSNTGEVLVHGQRALVVGRVCMDQSLADVSHIPGAQSGDDVVIYGSQKGNSITIEEMARRLGRIPYELTCSVGSRVRRRYTLNGEMMGETPMRSLVPSDVLTQIFRATQSSSPDSQTDRRGAA
ncbi:MAG: alanine racemase [Planctomycetota bacterium]